MSRIDVPTLQCDRCKGTTTDPKVMEKFKKLKSDEGIHGESWDLCGDCWTWFKQRFLTKIGSLPVTNGQPCVSAKIRVTGKGPVTNQQVALSFTADYLDDRNHEWAYHTPALSLNMTVKESVSNLFGVNQPFTLLFFPEGAKDATWQGWTNRRYSAIDVKQPQPIYKRWEGSTT